MQLHGHLCPKHVGIELSLQGHRAGKLVTGGKSNGRASGTQPMCCPMYPLVSVPPPAPLLPSPYMVSDLNPASPPTLSKSFSLRGSHCLLTSYPVQLTSAIAGEL